MQETKVRSLSQEDPPEKEMATRSSIPAWEIPWTEEPGGLQFIGSQRVRRDLATKQQQKYVFIYFDHAPRQVGTLAPQPGIKPMSPALQAQSLTHGNC